MKNKLLFRVIYHFLYVLFIVFLSWEKKKVLLVRFVSEAKVILIGIQAIVRLPKVTKAESGILSSLPCFFIYHYQSLFLTVDTY